MHQPRTKAHAPQRRRTYPVSHLLEILGGTLPRHLAGRTRVVLYQRNDDAVAGPDIVHQKIAKRMEGLTSERCGDREGTAVDLRARGRCSQGSNVADGATDFVEQ